MNLKLSNLFMFAAGVIVGSIVTYKYMEKKYFTVEEEFDYEEDFVEEDKTSYEEVIKYYTNPETVKEEKDMSVAGPYIISPEEFGENDYEEVSLNYYADGVITDDQDYVVEDTSVIGIDPAEHFGEYEDDSVFVRNDELKIDYEILRDLRKYHDMYPEEK